MYLSASFYLSTKCLVLNNNYHIHYFNEKLYETNFFVLTIFASAAIVVAIKNVIYKKFILQRWHFKFGKKENAIKLLHYTTVIYTNCLSILLEYILFFKAKCNSKETSFLF